MQQSEDLIDLTKLRGSSCYGIASLFQTNSRISTADFLPDLDALNDKVIFQELYDFTITINHIVNDETYFQDDTMDDDDDTGFGADIIMDEDGGAPPPVGDFCWRRWRRRRFWSWRWRRFRA